MDRQIDTALMKNDTRTWLGLETERKVSRRAYTHTNASNVRIYLDICVAPWYLATGVAFVAI
jgi:hypothetical protein